MTRSPLRRSLLCRCPIPLVLALLLPGCGEPPPSVTVAGGNAQAGKLAIDRYGCIACHKVPGILGHGANVGPPLEKMSEQAYIAGVIANTPENLIRWLQHPPRIDPLTAMPDLGISEREARDIAAYLYDNS